MTRNVEQCIKFYLYLTSESKAALRQVGRQAGGILLCVLRNAFVLRSTLPHIIVIPRVLSAGVEKKLTPRL